MSFFDELGNLTYKLSPTGVADVLGASDGQVGDLGRIDPMFIAGKTLGVPGYEGSKKSSAPAPAPGASPTPATGVANHPAVPVQDPNRQMYQPEQLPLHGEGFMKPVQPVQMRNSQMDEISKLLRGG